MIEIEELFYLNRLLDNLIIPGFEVGYLFNRDKSDEELKKSLNDKDIIITKDDMNFKAFMLIGRLKQFKEAKKYVWINDRPYSTNKQSNVFSIYKGENDKVIFEKIARVELVNRTIKEYEFISRMIKKSDEEVTIDDFKNYFEIDTNINGLRKRKDLLILKKENDGIVSFHNCYFLYKNDKVYKYDLLKQSIEPYKSIDAVNDLIRILYDLKVKDKVN